MRFGPMGRVSLVCCTLLLTCFARNDAASTTAASTTSTTVDTAKLDAELLHLKEEYNKAIKDAEQHFAEEQKKHAEREAAREAKLAKKRAEQLEHRKLKIKHLQEEQAKEAAEVKAATTKETILDKLNALTARTHRAKRRLFEQTHKDAVDNLHEEMALKKRELDQKARSDHMEQSDAHLGYLRSRKAEKERRRHEKQCRRDDYDHTAFDDEHHDDLSHPLFGKWHRSSKLARDAKDKAERKKIKAAKKSWLHHEDTPAEKLQDTVKYYRREADSQIKDAHKGYIKQKNDKKYKIKKAKSKKDKLKKKAKKEKSKQEKAIKKQIKKLKYQQAKLKKTSF